MSQNAESKFVNTKNKKFDFFKSCIKKEVWELFCKKFKSDVTAASYKSDLSEFCRFTEKCFQETDFSDVQKYYIYAKKDKKWTDRSIDSDKKIQGTSFFFKIFVRRVERQIRR